MTMHKKKVMTTRTLLSAALVMALALTGCGDDKASSPSQVLARVNGDEITVLQLNYLLAQNQNLPKEEQRSKQALLDELIQQQLLVQLATEKKLSLPSARCWPRLLQVKRWPPSRTRQRPI